jgi:hypothetical protein
VLGIDQRVEIESVAKGMTKEREALHLSIGGGGRMKLLV